jgi:alanine-synthesizing transaminase
MTSLPKSEGSAPPLGSSSLWMRSSASSVPPVHPTSSIALVGHLGWPVPPVRSLPVPVRSNSRIENPEGTAPLIHLNGLSKLCAAPEIKLGWIVISGGSPEDRAELVDALDTEHDTYLTLSGIGEVAAIAFLEGEAPPRRWYELRLAVEAARDAMVTALSRLPGIEPAPVDSGIHVPFRLDPLVAAERAGSVDDETIAVRMVEQVGLLVHPGYFYGLDYPAFADGPWFVASSLISRDTLERGIEGLRVFLCD